MRHLFSIFACLAVLFATGFVRAEETFLLWQISDGDANPPDGQIVQEIDGDYHYINEILSRPDGYRVNALRIHVTGEGVDEYLTMLNHSEDGSWSKGGTYYDVTWDDDMVDVDGVNVGPSWSDVSAYANSAYSFVMELGYHDADVDWVIMAVSPEETWSDLESFTASSPIFALADPWRPAFVVPEPTSGILVLFGLAALSLRRRRQV